MQKKIIISGFGGQGAIFAGKLIGLAGLKSGKNVTHVPSYGAEMRGGTANCSVIVADEEIGSPIIEECDVCIAFNKPSVSKFIDSIKSKGQLIYNSTLVDFIPKRDDIDIKGIAATAIAQSMGSIKATNVLIVGYFSKLFPKLFSLEKVEESLKIILRGKGDSLLTLNKKILNKGFNLA